jgi:hypothetical protein
LSPVPGAKNHRQIDRFVYPRGFHLSFINFGGWSSGWIDFRPSVGVPFRATRPFLFWSPPVFVPFRTALSLPDHLEPMDSRGMQVIAFHAVPPARRPLNVLQGEIQVHGALCGR